METVNTFGQWVKARRKKLDLTQEHLGQEIGCSLATIKKIESDERRPSRQIALLLAKRLQLSPEQSDVFVRVARGELSLDRLPSLIAPLPTEPHGIQQPARTAADQRVAMKNNIPLPVTPLVGRERELAEISRLMQEPQCRLLTLTGVGGTGKTRLAIEAALQLREVFKENVFFVSLAGVGSPSLVPAAIAGAFGLNFSGPMDTKLQLFHYLHPKKTLLVLDNLEHLLEGLDLLGELLQHVPDLKLLVTSREQMHLQAEWVFEVRGLPVPQTVQAEAIEASSACRLFIQTAQRAQSGFHVVDEDYTAIWRICQMVQGLPLAIELAARWTRVLSCVEIAREIERGQEFLAANSREVAPRDISSRHRSLQSVFDHSWGLLTREEQQVLKQLSVFRGGFRREAAEQIAGANLSVLLALIDKSLLLRGESNRYDLHELVRQYLGARLAENDQERDAAYRQHSRYYLALLQKSEPSLRSSRQREALAELAADIDNIRLAWRSAIEHETFDLLNQSATALYTFCELQQYFTEAVALFRQAAEAARLAHSSDNKREPVREQACQKAALANLVNFQAFFNLRQGNNHQALELFETSLSLLRPLVQMDTIGEAKFPFAFGSIHAGVVYWALGEFEQAARYIENGLAASRWLDYPWLRGLGLGFLGGVCHDRGDYQAAYEDLREAMQILMAGGDPYMIMFIGTYYSRTLMVLNHLDEAHTLLKAGLQGIRSTGNRWLTALGLEYLAKVARLSGNDTEAGSLLEESLQLHREVGDPWSLTLSLLEMSRHKLRCADFTSAEQHVLEALKLTAESGSIPIAMDGFVLLAALCANQGMNAEALCLTRHILQHPSSRQDTRDQAEELETALAARADTGQQVAPTIDQHTCLEVLMQERFGLRLPPMFLETVNPAK